jgi:two-component system phosphate regulon sensor histidine kinase PhoR
VKLLNPFLSILLGSLLVGISLAALLFLFLPSTFQWQSILLIASAGFLISFLVFYFFIKQFIYRRLKILYRTIRTHKFKEGEKLKINMTQDVIGKAEQEAVQWKDKQTREVEELKQYERLRKEFIGNLAHELKTPLFSIQGYVHTLLDGGIDDSEVNRDFLERASKSIERMEHILNDLDNLNKMERETFKLALRPFNLKELCKEIIESLELIAKSKGIHLSFDKEHSKELMVVADRDKIAQVLVNLIQNSISYGKDNGETTLRFYEMDDLVTVEVSDNGAGIEPNEQPRIFERFYRVEKSRVRNEGGSGLGLSIVKHIIDAHNQTISVRSTIGVGSTFTFSLDLFHGNQQSLLSSRGVQIK